MGPAQDVWAGDLDNRADTDFNIPAGFVKILIEHAGDSAVLKAVEEGCDEGEGQLDTAQHHDGALQGDPAHRGEAGAAPAHPRPDTALHRVWSD